MSLAQIIEISCDVDGCEESFTADGVGRIEARRRATAEGWTRPDRPGSVPRPDLCPRHSTKPKRTLPCVDCGEPMTVPAGARQASHGGRCRGGAARP